MASKPVSATAPFGPPQIPQADELSFRSELGSAGDQANATLQRDWDESTSDSEASLAAFKTCMQYVEQLHDLGYQAEAQELYRNCRTTLAQCRINEQIVQSNPHVAGGYTYFPLQNRINGGGYIVHRKGLKPVYLEPNQDPLAGILPRK